MNYALVGKVDVSKGVTSNFHFCLDNKESVEDAKKDAKVIIDLELRGNTILEAVIKCGNEEIKRYPRIEKGEVFVP
jgi:hypothetical protein